ncbi:MAG: carbohydrate ABC transporter permease [Treponema sp.]|jgi:putative aldouronate transport system permease protein|nr:carbohydrate ABC transporter permease [Treponema sp.]
MVVIGRRSIGDTVFVVVNYTILTLFFLLCIYPFYYIFIYSISDPKEAAKGLSVLFLPVKPTLSNYVEVFKMDGIVHATFISVARTVIGTLITVVCCGFFAYLVTKPLYFRKFIYRMMIVTMYVGGGLIPWYVTMRMYHMYNNFLVYVIPSALSAMNVILIKTFIEQLPASLEESARLDGAGYMRIFLQIIAPLSKPILATIVVFSAVGQWGSWFDNYILVTPENLKTIQLMLYDMVRRANVISNATNIAAQLAAMDEKMTPMAIRMTVTMVVTFPIILVYPFMQRYFIKGIMMGAIKG